jgi:hypothetical protein
MILDQKFRTDQPGEEGVVHKRDSNIDRIARFKVRREQPTQKVCSQ